MGTNCCHFLSIATTYFDMAFSIIEIGKFIRKVSLFFYLSKRRPTIFTLNQRSVVIDVEQVIILVPRIIMIRGRLSGNTPDFRISALSRTRSDFSKPVYVDACSAAVNFRYNFIAHSPECMNYLVRPYARINYLLAFMDFDFGLIHYHTVTGRVLKF